MNLEELLSTLQSPIVIRPTRRMTQGELESYLDTAANILRGNADHSEFRGYVFALLFYKRISDCFDEEVRTQVATLTKAGLPQDQALLLARDPQNHHFIVPEAAAWAAVARTAKAQLGQALNDAMLAIERANAHRQNNFDGILTGKIDFNKQDELPRDKLVNLINHFSSHFGLVSGPPGTLHQANRRHRSSPERRAGHRSRHCAPGAPLEAGPDLLRSSWRSRPSAAPWPLLRPLRAWRRRA